MHFFLSPFAPENLVYRLVDEDSTEVKTYHIEYETDDPPHILIDIDVSSMDH